MKEKSKKEDEKQAKKKLTITGNANEQKIMWGYGVAAILLGIAITIYFAQTVRLKCCQGAECQWESRPYFGLISSQNSEEEFSIERVRV